MNLDPLRPGDLQAAFALSTGGGWNQTAADWSRLVALEPLGCFAARDGARLVGTVTTITYGPALAWIGMMVVHPESRRQGIGVALMRAALDYLRVRGIASLMLDATPPGRPLYESLGFTAEAETATYLGPLVATAASAAERLLDGMLARLAGQEVCLDLHRGGLLDPVALAARGPSMRRGLIRMRHGPRGPAGAARSVCASAGPELG